jgi:hypothetical protein
MAFDISLTPKSAAPTSTTNVTLFTAAADSSVLVDVVNLSTSAVLVRVGIDPSTTALQWKVFDYSIAKGDALLGLGPFFLQSGDAVVCRSGTANNAAFTLSGVRS